MLRLPACRGALLVLLMLAVVLTLPAAASRYHVRSGGTLTEGASSPGIWHTYNCYATLEAAAAQAGAGDSLLVYGNDIQVAASVALDEAFLGNSLLSSDPAGMSLDLGLTGQLRPTASLTMQGLGITATGGQRALSAMLVDTQDLTLTGCQFTGIHGAADSAGGGGAAIFMGGVCRLTATDCYFTGSVSNERGGAVRLVDGVTAVFTDCVLRDNTTLEGGDPRGGAVFASGQWVPTSVQFIRCDLSDNQCGGPGGAVSTLSASSEFIDCTVVGNRSGLSNGWSEGVGLHHRRNSSDVNHDVAAVVRGCYFEDNVGFIDVEFNGGDGGAFYASGTNFRYIDVTVEDSEFRENYNLQGSGVYVSIFTNGVVRRCRFIDNRAYHMGAGVFRGGRHYECVGETLRIEHCLFLRNEAGFFPDGTPTDTYCRGGAICVRMYPRVIVEHCTFIENKIFNSGYRFGDAFAHYFEFGQWEPDMLCEMRNCVFWGDNGTHVQAWSSEGGMAAVENIAAMEGEINLGGLAVTDPVVLTASPFTDLLEGRPTLHGGLVDAGTALGYTQDLEGNPMPVGRAADIGCYEHQPSVGVDDLPLAAATISVAPNPFNPRTVLSLRLDHADDVRVLLMDARGHRVRVLQSGRLAAGDHRWTWDGRDHAGRDCAAGVYLAHVLVGDGTATSRKLTLVR